MVLQRYILRVTGIGLLAALLLTAPAGAQTLTVQDGATLTLGGGATLDLGTATTLAETTGGRVTGGTGTVTATRTLSTPDAVDVAGLGAVITSEANLGPTTVTRGHAAQTAGGNEGIARYYDIAPATNTDLDATLVFHYHDAELNGLDETTLLLYHSGDDGASWTERDATLDPGANTVTRAGIDALARWTIASSDAPLPVELTTFEAVRAGEAVRLKWTTASETNNAGFEVQAREKESAGAWEPLGFVEGAGTTSEPQSYTFSAGGLDVGTYAFRLEQVDADGTSAYSEEVELTLSLGAAHRVSAPYPNPAHGAATLDLTVREAQHVEVAVYDALGRRVATLYDGELPANRTERIRLDGHRLPSGLYLVRAVGEGFAATRRITLVR